MVRTGIVKSKKGDMLRVCFETPEHCAGCRGCSRGFLPKHELLTVFGDFAYGSALGWKWRGVPVWSHGGILCTGESYKKAVKLTFAKGASLPDPKGLFNASLDGNTRRAIDLHEGDTLDATAFKALVRAAVKHNQK